MATRVFENEDDDIEEDFEDNNNYDEDDVGVALWKTINYSHLLRILL